MLFSYPNLAVAGVKTANRRGCDPRDQCVAEKGHTMKREFLLNFKVGEEPLPKEIVDAIMAENGRDVEAAKTAAVKPYADYETIKEENQRLKDQQADGTVDGKTAQQWKDDYEKAVSDHSAELAGIKFQNLLDGAITQAKGRNTKAITAMLDVEALKGSEDQQAAIKAALEDLKKGSGYLFDEEGAPPPYAGGTGTKNNPPAAPETLAGALREKFAQK